MSISCLGGGTATPSIFHEIGRQQQILSAMTRHVSSLIRYNISLHLICSHNYKCHDPDMIRAGKAGQKARANLPPPYRNQSGQASSTSIFEGESGGG